VVPNGEELSDAGSIPAASTHFLRRYRLVARGPRSLTRWRMPGMTRAETRTATNTSGNLARRIGPPGHSYGCSDAFVELVARGFVAVPIRWDLEGSHRDFEFEAAGAAAGSTGAAAS